MEVRFPRQPRYPEQQRGLQKPQSVEELINVSIATAGPEEDPLSRLNNEQARNVDLHLVVAELESRLNRYLLTTVEAAQGNTIVPSDYARAIFELSSLPSEQRTKDTRWKQVQEIDEYIRPEITFLLQQLMQQLGCSGPELLKRLGRGRSDDRDVATVFSVWNRLQPFELDVETIRSKVVVMNPFEIGNLEAEKYWEGHGRYFKETLGSAGMPRSIEFRRERVMGELETAAATIPAVREDCQVLIDWLEHTVGSISPNASAEAFGYYTATMDFMQLDPSESIPLLSALAALKQHCPSFYLRLIGIAPTGHRETGEMQLSDLFGSPIQVAMYRLGQHNDLPPAIQTYADQFTQLDVEQTELLYIDNERFKQINAHLNTRLETEKSDRHLGRRVRGEKPSTPKEGEGLSSAVLAAVALLRPEVVQAYQMQKEMRAMMEAAHNEHLSGLRHVMEHGTPNDILLRLRWALNRDHFKVVSAMARKRIQIPYSAEDINLTNLAFPTKEQREPILKLATELWRTAPAEQLGTEEFADFVIAQSNQAVLETGAPAIISVVKAHHLSADQWRASALYTALPERTVTSSYRLVNFIQDEIFRSEQGKAIESKQKLIEALIRIFKITPLEQLWNNEVGPQLGAFYAGVDSKDLRAAAVAKTASDDSGHGIVYGLLPGADHSGVLLRYHQLKSEGKGLGDGKSIREQQRSPEGIILTARLADGVIDFDSIDSSKMTEDVMQQVTKMLTSDEVTKNVNKIQDILDTLGMLGKLNPPELQAYNTMKRWVEILKSTTD